MKISRVLKGHKYYFNSNVNFHRILWLGTVAIVEMKTQTFAKVSGELSHIITWLLHLPQLLHYCVNYIKLESLSILFIDKVLLLIDWLIDENQEFYMTSI